MRPVAGSLLTVAIVEAGSAKFLICASLSDEMISGTSTSDRPVILAAMSTALAAAPAQS